MIERARAIAATVLAEEIRRRAGGPGHIANAAVTWQDLRRVLEEMERVALVSAFRTAESGGNPDPTDQIEVALSVMSLGGLARPGAE